MFKKIKIIEQEKFYLGMTLLFLFVQWLVIAMTSVNVPAGDEWDSLNSNALPAGFNWNYIFAFHNEHRGVFTKLQNYIFFKFTDWNMVYQIHFNYIIFCSIVLFLLWFQKKNIIGSTKGVWVLLFFMASPLIVDNHNWAIQSFFHYFELFGLLAMYFATKQSLRTSDFWLAALFATFSTYAFAAGMFFAFVVAGVLVYRLVLEPKKSSMMFLARGSSVLALVGCMGLWFVGYHKPPGHPALVWPYDIDFWYFFSNSISLGFGFKTSSAIIALIALGFAAAPLWPSLRKAFSFKHQYVSFAFFGAMAVLGALSSIALSRAGFGIGQAKTSRYAELSILLVPFVGWLLWDLAQNSERYRKIFKYFIWFIFLGFAGDYSYSTYFRVQQDRQEALVCISKYYSGENKTGDCPVLYPGPIGERLDVAKKLKLSWVPAQ